MSFPTPLDSFFYDVGNFWTIYCAIPCWLFALVYGFVARWYRSLLGVAVYSLILSLAFLFSLAFLRRSFDIFPGYYPVSASIYTFVALSLTFFFCTFLYIRFFKKRLVAEMPLSRHTGEVPIQPPVSNSAAG